MDTQKEQKSNFKEIAAIVSVPVVTIVLILIGAFLPKLIETPSQDFIYYQTYTNDEQANAVSVDIDGKVLISPQEVIGGNETYRNGVGVYDSYNDSLNSYYDNPQALRSKVLNNLKYYDVSERKVRSATEQDVENVRLQTSKTSDNGFTLEHKKTEGSSIVSDNSRLEWYLTKGSVRHKANIDTIYSVPQNDIRFIGWVKK